MERIESPQTTDSAIEREIVAKGKTAPRVTPADLQANIVNNFYFTAAEEMAGAVAAMSSNSESQPVLRPRTSTLRLAARSPARTQSKKYGRFSGTS